jgi:hypothetical protein
MYGKYKTKATVIFSSFSLFTGMIPYFIVGGKGIIWVIFAWIILSRRLHTGKQLIFILRSTPLNIVAEPVHFCAAPAPACQRFSCFQQIFIFSHK